jgi:hypothetical protein
MSKAQIVETMARISDIESRKSIIGKVNTFDGDVTSKIMDKSNQDSEKQKAARNISFFSLDETGFKLKKADWLN